MGEFIQDIIDGLAPDLLGAFVDGIKVVVDTLLDFLYSFIFVDCKSACLSCGSKIFNFFTYNFLSQPFTLQSLIYIAGFVFVVYCINKGIHIIRG